MHEIMSAQPLAGFRLLVTLADGTEKEVDVEEFISTGQIFRQVHNDPTYFSQVYVDSIDGTVTWPNGANIDTEVLLGHEACASHSHS